MIFSPLFDIYLGINTYINLGDIIKTNVNGIDISYDVIGIGNPIILGHSYGRWLDLVIYCMLAISIKSLLYFDNIIIDFV